MEKFISTTYPLSILSPLDMKKSREFIDEAYLQKKIDTWDTYKRGDFVYKKLNDFLESCGLTQKISLQRALHLASNEDTLVVLLRSSLRPDAQSPPPDKSKDDAPMDYKKKITKVRYPELSTT